MKQSIFKPCDIRGVYPDELDEDAAYRIARAFGTFVGGVDTLLAGDVRPSTASLKQAVAEGLVKSGCAVHDVGIVPTPVFYYARRRLCIYPGILVTASHNPPEYNGFKIVPGYLPVTQDEIDAIKDLALNQNFGSGVGTIVHREVLNDYEEWIVSEIGRYLSIKDRLPKVVLDCGNGCYSEIAPRVFERLGFSVARLFCEADGTFPNRSPNSAIPANLRKLSETTVAVGAELGIAFDGDGDRVSFVDESGTFVVMDKAIAILACNLPNPLKLGDKVVLDIKTSSAVAEAISKMGAVPIIEKSGHTYMKTRVIRERARFGGEISGHFFYDELHGDDDGLYSALIMSGIVARSGPLSRLASEVPSYATTPDIRLHVNSDPALLLDQIAAAFPPDRVNRLDGVRVDFDNGWGLARISVTEPVITLRFEGKNRQDLHKVIDEFLRPVPGLKEMIQLENLNHQIRAKKR